MTHFPIGIFGVLAILAIAVLLSSNRRAIRLRIVGPAFLLQAGMAIIVLRTAWGQVALHSMANGVSALLGYASAGTQLLFGNLAKPELGGQSLAIAALPVIVFFAALVSILYHVGIMQQVVRWIGGAIEKVTGVSKVESLCAAANIFVGQSEAPLVIRPYLARLAPSQVFAVMSVGMAGVAGTILAAYASLLGPASLPYLLAASFMAAPGGLMMAKIIMPDEPVVADAPMSGEDEVIRVAEEDFQEERAANIIMAAANGASTGVKIAVAVGAMVLAFVALVALANGLLGVVGGWFGFPGLSFQAIIGTIFAPVMYLLGISWHESLTAGGLFGTKVVLNEFVGFIELGKATDLAPRSRAIITFALCGFANFSSIAIQMATTGSLAPNQRPVIARLGVKALIAGSLANLMSAALAGLLLP
ncbi:NupC/NupG family nucleoside CNT transporter [Sphingomonas sp.]|uniref:NupC/NupG family nucleoside CNT transporter n=1 Tax=Sphingomonas sp. TaxID=28214 RepID=UPI002FDB6DAC